MIEIDDVTKCFSDKQVISGITETINDGESFTIIGPSGQGKTTLLRIISMLETPTSGEVRIDGETASMHASLELRRRVGIVFQQPTAFKESVFYNIALGMRYRGYRKDTIQERISSVLDRTGLSGYENRKALTLSGGEMQRVSFARVLVTEPDILLLDEPTANLDPVSIQVIESLISEYHKDGHTVLMSTHDLFQGQRLCDRIAAMMNGTFIQSGSPKEVFTWPASVNVARFIGISNIFDCTVKECTREIVTIQTDFGIFCGIRYRKDRLAELDSMHAGEKGSVSIRPEEFKIYPAQHAERLSIKTDVNHVVGCVTAITPYGLLTNVSFECGSGTLIAQLRWRQLSDFNLSIGDPIYADIPYHAVHYMNCE
jgi:tungstate transport system ATP-binding protein